MKEIDENDNQIPLLLEKWGGVKNKLSLLYENRDRKNALEPMVEGIEIFHIFLFLCNDIERFDNEKVLEELIWKPVNITERLSFIKKRPDLYHSFIQLTELMTEQEKLFNKKKAIEKVTKQ